MRLRYSVFREFAIGGENHRARAIFTLTRLPAYYRSRRMGRLAPRSRDWQNAKVILLARHRFGWSCAECHVRDWKRMSNSQNIMNIGRGIPSAPPN